VCARNKAADSTQSGTHVAHCIVLGVHQNDLKVLVCGVLQARSMHRDGWSAAVSAGCWPPTVGATYTPPHATTFLPCSAGPSQSGAAEGCWTRPASQCVFSLPHLVDPVRVQHTEGTQLAAGALLCHRAVVAVGLQLGDTLVDGLTIHNTLRRTGRSTQ
jgi:hypothetical protein